MPTNKPAGSGYLRSSSAANCRLRTDPGSPNFYTIRMLRLEAPDLMQSIAVITNIHNHKRTDKRRPHGPPAILAGDCFLCQGLHLNLTLR